MNDLISVFPNRCTGCGACVRACPAPEAIVFEMKDGKRVTAVNNEKCTACGKCISACPHDARDFEDDSDRFFKDIKSKRIVLIVSPAIKAAFPDTWQGVLKWLRSEEVYALYDMSLGGDICAWANLRLAEQGKIKNVISSHCPAVVNYVNIYHPDKTDTMLSPVYTPAGCMAAYIKKHLKVSYSIAVLSPCTAVRTDPAECNLIDYSVTFKRLEEIIARKRVKLAKNSEGQGTAYFDDELGTLGSALSRTAGLRDNIWARNADIDVFAADSSYGFGCIEKTSEVPDSARPVIADIMACSKGCAYGHACAWDASAFERDKIMHFVELDGRARRKTGIAGIVGNADRQFKHFDDTFNIKFFMRTYKPAGEGMKEVSKSEIDHVLAEMGKETDEQKNLNCGFCGYESCSAMAEAICRGCNIPENCISYAQGAISGNNRELSITKSEAKEIADEINSISGTIAEKISRISDNFSGMIEANKQTSSKSALISNVLSKIIGFCNGNDYIGEDELPILVSTMEKLQATLDLMNDNVKTVTENSGTIDSAVKEMTDEAEKLADAVERMIESFNSKY